MQTDLPTANGNGIDGAIPSDRTPPAAPGEDFLRELLQHQNRLYAFIVSLLANRQWADDVFQETNLVLWRKANEFAPGSDFLAWAFQIARYQCLAASQKRGREKLLFDDETIAGIAARVESHSPDADDRRAALRHCLENLPVKQRALIEERYATEGTIEQLAETTGHPAGSLAQTLYRIRNTLLDCIRRRMSGTT